MNIIGVIVFFMLIIGGLWIVFSAEIGELLNKKEQKKVKVWRDNLRTASLDEQYGECTRNIENFNRY